MPSALILSRPGYPAMPRARQPAHQRSVLPNPLVLGETLLKFPTPTADRDRPVSRRSEPSSRTAFIGEQPNPWELLHPQDAMSRHRTVIHAFTWCRLYLLLAPDISTPIEKWCVVSVGNSKTRRIASIANRSLSFRISRYRVIQQHKHMCVFRRSLRTK